MDGKGPQSGSRQRIDKWLFFARVAKSRSLAQERVAAGHVSVNGQKIRFVHEDDQYKPEETVRLAKELLARESPVAFAATVGTANADAQAGPHPGGRAGVTGGATGQHGGLAVSRRATGRNALRHCP